MTKKIVFQLDDDKLVDKFYRFLKDDVATILEYAKLEDQNK